MLTDFSSLAADLVRDDAARLQAAEIDRAVAAAVHRYAEDKPQTKVQDVTPESANLLPLPAAWEEGFSTILAIEHPKGEIPPVYLDQGRYQVYDDGTAKKIQVFDAVAVAAASVRVGFTIKHVVSAVADTVPLPHREPVACLAAASLCDQLAAFYAGGTDSTIQADSVESRSKAQEYASRAKILRKRYHDELGIEDKRAVPAGTVVQVKGGDSWGGPRLNHPSPVR